MNGKTRFSVLYWHMHSSQACPVMSAYANNYNTENLVLPGLEFGKSQKAVEKRKK